MGNLFDKMAVLHGWLLWTGWTVALLEISERLTTELGSWIVKFEQIVIILYTPAIYSVELYSLQALHILIHTHIFTVQTIMLWPVFTSLLTTSFEMDYNHIQTSLFLNPQCTVAPVFQNFQLHFPTSYWGKWKKNPLQITYDRHDCFQLIIWNQLISFEFLIS